MPHNAALRSNDVVNCTVRVIHHRYWWCRSEGAACDARAAVGESGERLPPMRPRKCTTARVVDAVGANGPHGGQLPFSDPISGKNTSCQDAGALLSSPVLAIKAASFISPVGATE